MQCLKMFVTLLLCYELVVTKCLSMNTNWYLDTAIITFTVHRSENLEYTWAEMNSEEGPLAGFTEHHDGPSGSTKREHFVILVIAGAVQRS